MTYKVAGNGWLTSNEGGSDKEKGNRDGKEPRRRRRSPGAKPPPDGGVPCSKDVHLNDDCQRDVDDGNHLHTNQHKGSDFHPSLHKLCKLRLSPSVLRNL